MYDEKLVSDHPFKDLAKDGSINKEYTDLFELTKDVANLNKDIEVDSINSEHPANGVTAVQVGKGLVANGTYKGDPANFLVYIALGFEGNSLRFVKVD